MKLLRAIHLGDHCIKNFHLGRYIIGYTVQNLRASENVISERIFDNIPPKMKNLNMVIPILMHFCSLDSNLSVASCIKPHVVQQNVT